MPEKKQLHPAEFPDAIRFAERLLDPSRWIETADELLSAARLLEPEIETYWAAVRMEGGTVVEASARTPVHGQYFMLIAYAIENLLKAERIHRHRPTVRNRLLAKIPTFMKTHDLLALFKAAPLVPDLADEGLLTRLSRSAVWAGRYPVPTEPSALRVTAQYSDGNQYLVAFFGPDDVARAAALVARVRAFAVASIQAPPNIGLQPTATGASIGRRRG